MATNTMIRRLATQTSVLLGRNSIKSQIAPFTIASRKESTTSALETRPTIRKFDPVQRETLTDFGKYVAECMPKFVQKVQLTAGDELEILIAPEGLLPVMAFLKDHHNAQFANLVDIAGLDMPTREYRFEVVYNLLSLRYNARIRVKTYTDEMTPLGTIHILHKHLFSTNLDSTSKFFTKTSFFVITKEFLFQYYILTNFSCCMKNFKLQL